MRRSCSPTGPATRNTSRHRCTPKTRRSRRCVNSGWSTSGADLVTADVTVTLRPAGHILGASTATVELVPSGRRIVFSGDLGRPSHPLLVPPHPPSDADIVVMESTYGGRQHDDDGAIEEFASVITRTARRGGTVVIPAFAVDRRRWCSTGCGNWMATERALQLPVYVDSPTALRALGVYRRAIADGSAEVRSELRGGTDPFDTGRCTRSARSKSRRRWPTSPIPQIIVSASGMATLSQSCTTSPSPAPDRRNAVVLVGQAAGTRGRRLAEGETEIKMFGRYLRVRSRGGVHRLVLGACRPRRTHAVAHAAEPPPETVFLVHGEREGAEALKASIVDDLDWPAVVARPMERIRLD
ncbi:MAG: MBL fold metallo-hydrolase [Acidimicrobiales bacterium]